MRKVHLFRPRAGTLLKLEAIWEIPIGGVFTFSNPADPDPKADPVYVKVGYDEGFDLLRGELVTFGTLDAVAYRVHVPSYINGLMAVKYENAMDDIFAAPLADD